MWSSIVGLVFSASAVMFFGSLFGSFEVGIRTYVEVTTRHRFRMILLISGIVMLAAFVGLIILKGSISAALPSIGGSFFGVLILTMAGEFWRWKKVPTRELRKRYWQYRWVQAKTTTFPASTADYSVLMSRCPEDDSPDEERLIAQLSRSTKNVTDEQWRLMLTDWWREWVGSTKSFPPSMRGNIYYTSRDDDVNNAISRIAGLPGVPSEWLTVLAMHPDEWVRTAVAGNPSASDEVKVTAALMGVRPLTSEFDGFLLLPRTV